MYGHSVFFIPIIHEKYQQLIDILKMLETAWTSCLEGAELLRLICLAGRLGDGVMPVRESPA